MGQYRVGRFRPQRTPLIFPEALNRRSPSELPTACCASEYWPAMPNAPTPHVPELEDFPIPQVLDAGSGIGHQACLGLEGLHTRINHRSRVSSLCGLLNPPPGSSPPAVGWLSEHNPELYARALADDGRKLNI